MSERGPGAMRLAREGVMAVWRIAVSVVVVAFVAIGCGSRDDGGGRAGAAPLAPITLPELTRVDPPVQAQIREKFAEVSKMAEAGTAAPRELGTAFGQYGMLLHAAEYHEAATPAYLNAQALVPDDHRWPYYLAQLYRAVGDTAAAMAAFQRVLELQPNEVASLIWLGRMYIDQGQPDRAEPLFARAQSAAPGAIAAQVGLGQVALAKKDYSRAVQLLEGALNADPGAGSIYAPLAMAYRGLGQHDRAASLSQEWRNTELTVPDPLRAELDTVLQSGLSFELRGVRELEASNFVAAADLFRQGLALAPPKSALSRSLRHKLGTALALSGDTTGGMREFEETVREAPEGALDEPAAKASYSLGIVYAGAGRTADAVRHLNLALGFKPNYFEALVALGDVFRTAGRFADSLPPYEEAVRMNPRAAEARFSRGIALIRLRRWADARTWLEQSVRAQPDRPELANMLARLLATSPDASLRDGQRALAMARQLAETHRNTELGETMAMALAEVGSYREAVAVQRDVLQAARQAGDGDAIRRMEANLRLFESGRPARNPWPEDDPVFTTPIR